MSHVEKLITGRDDRVRGAVLKLPPKNGQQTTLQRPLQLIYPLEITQSESYPEGGYDATLKEISPENDSIAGDQVEPHARPQRVSALKA